MSARFSRSFSSSWSIWEEGALLGPRGKVIQQLLDFLVFRFQHVLRSLSKQAEEMVSLEPGWQVLKLILYRNYCFSSRSTCQNPLHLSICAVPDAPSTSDSPGTRRPSHRAVGANWLCPSRCFLHVSTPWPFSKVGWMGDPQVLLGGNLLILTSGAGPCVKHFCHKLPWAKSSSHPSSTAWDNIMTSPPADHILIPVLSIVLSR